MSPGVEFTDPASGVNFAKTNAGIIFRREADGLGGPYGRNAREELGWHPTNQLVFIRDATVIDGGDPSTVKYNAAWTQLQAKKTDVDGSAAVHVRIIAVIDGALGSIGSACLRGKIEGGYVPTGASAPEPAPNHQASLIVKLIKTPLVDGLSVEQITHDDLGDLTLETLLETDPVDWTGDGSSSGNITLDGSDLSGGASVYANPAAVKSAGPYYGLLLEMDGSTSFTQPGDTLTTFFNLQNSRDVVDAILRSFVIPSGLYGA